MACGDIRRQSSAELVAIAYCDTTPTWDMSRCPNVPMREYISEMRADGLPADPWLRTHLRAGGRVVKIAPYSMTIIGSIADWSTWTGATLDQSGEVAVAGGLAPLIVSLEQGYVVYVEPNVWVEHVL